MSFHDCPHQVTLESSTILRGILLDIEGTTTPIAFVHQVLFPFARSRVRDYLTAHMGEAAIDADIASLRQEHAIDVENETGPPPLIDAPSTDQTASIVAYVHWLIDRDRKSTGLKSLQGKIWQEGYRDGTLKAPVFSDVVPALKRWRQAGAKLGIYSSGSLLAQQLLFSHTELGDLTHLIDNYFDTTIGLKTATESYRHIAAALQRSESEILFISDAASELDAARAAGLQTLLCFRSGNPRQRESQHQVIRSFDEVQDLRAPI